MSAGSAQQPSPSSSRALATMALVVAIITMGSAFVAIRYAGATFDPASMALLRWLCAATVFAAICVVRRPRRPARGDLPAIAIAGLLAVCVYHVSLNAGERTVNAGAASMLVNTGPVLTAVLSVSFLGERLTGRAWLGVALGCVGAGLIGYAESGGFRIDPGLLLVGIATLTQPVYFVLQRPLLQRYGAIELTAFMGWIGIVPLLIFIPALIEELRTASPVATLSVVYLGVGPSVVGFACFSYALRVLGATRAASTLYTVSFVSALIAWLVLGELPAPLSFVGAIVALVGIMLVQRGRAVRTAVAAPTASTQARGTT